MRAKSRAVINKENLRAPQNEPLYTIPEKPVTRDRSHTLSPRSSSEMFDGTYAEKASKLEARPTLKYPPLVCGITTLMLMKPSPSVKKISQDDYALDYKPTPPADEPPINLSTNEQIIIEEALKEKQKIVCME